MPYNVMNGGMVEKVIQKAVGLAAQADCLDRVTHVKLRLFVLSERWRNAVEMFFCD